ncbi:HlyD family secretion protein [Pseudomonas sp. 2FG]|uniref:HlyD family secretion protein n=1 Tax=Pseudomonas sp. 2FG TaxID=2502191 RepID=UPI0010F7620C|nr:HlyD family efflux transporter periplasmic adaptor subunit [Pseudomonas sp. 2FG]
MRAERGWLLPLWLLLIAVSGCEREGSPTLLGTLEWDRVSLPAEASETILAWHTVEGERVQAGQLLLELDPRRQDARIAQAQGEVAQAQARLRELSNGPRPEAREAVAALLLGRRASQTVAEQDFDRSEKLYQRGLLAIAELDKARANRDQARAQQANVAALLRELRSGSRVEQLEQAAAALAAAQGNLAQLQVGRQHLSLRAPRAGRVDSLPFKPGDQPPQGATLVSLLVGEAPYARVFVPASQRSALHIGESLRVRVEGSAEPFAARVRSISSEASFTPYFALTGDDASRLVYRAELLLEGEAARQLPAGLPLSAERIVDERP